MFQLFSTFTAAGDVQLSLKKVDSPLDAELKPGHVVIKIEAAPINPSDIAKMLQMSPVSSTEKKDENGNVVLTLSTDNDYIKNKVKNAAGFSEACGNEGAGVVVKAGKGAEGLVGKVVAVAGGNMYGEYCMVHMAKCIPHLPETTPREAASSFVNPITVLCMIETMKKENHSAIIHTAAASNLGQMLQKLCSERGIPLINIVRKQAQEDALKDIGAKYVIRSDKTTFLKDLIAAVVETKATLAFDAIGGGKIQDTILTAMEAGAVQFSKEDTAASSFYGTSIHKQLYIYGGLDRSPTTLNRAYGLSWGISGFLMPRILATLGADKAKEMFGEVAKGIRTVFKSEYVREISLKEAVQKDVVLAYAKQETGKKYLINPQL